MYVCDAQRRFRSRGIHTYKKGQVFSLGTLIFLCFLFARPQVMSDQLGAYLSPTIRVLFNPDFNDDDEQEICKF